MFPETDISHNASSLGRTNRTRLRFTCMENPTYRITLITLASFNCLSLLLVFIVFYLIIWGLGDWGGGWGLQPRDSCGHKERVRSWNTLPGGLKIAPYGQRTIWHRLSVSWTNNNDDVNVVVQIIQCKVVFFLSSMAEMANRQRKTRSSRWEKFDRPAGGATLKKKLHFQWAKISRYWKKKSSSID